MHWFVIKIFKRVPPFRIKYTELSIDQKKECLKLFLLYQQGNSENKNDFQEICDSIRVFVNQFSAQKHVRFVTLNPDDIAGIAIAIRSYIEGVTTEPPVLLCGHRVTIAQQLFACCNYKSRKINFLTSKYPNEILGHIALEVFNEGTSRWELVDPDYDTFYLHEDGHRMSALDIIQSDFSSFKPCNGVACSWDNQSREGFEVRWLREYEMLGCFIYLDESQRLIYNPTRFNIRKKVNNQSLKKLYALYKISKVDTVKP
jgi:hypothetical protein